MFDAIKNAEAAECAGQYRALAEQAMQKAIYDAAVASYRNSRNDATRLKKAAEQFLTVPNYRNAKAQA